MACHGVDSLETVSIAVVVAIVVAPRADVLYHVDEEYHAAMQEMRDGQ